MPDRAAPEPDPNRVYVGRCAAVACAVLRLRAGDANLIRRAGEALGLILPRVPNTVASGQICAMWLAPNEWFLTADGATLPYAALEMALAGTAFVCADVGEGRIAYDITGGLARSLLARGTGIDLHPRVFRPESCAQTLFAGVPALLFLNADGASFRLYVDASFDAYLSGWLKRALAMLGQPGAIG
jgi:sarcosine oxidase subunit gamma